MTVPPTRVITDKTHVPLASTLNTSYPDDYTGYTSMMGKGRVYYDVLEKPRSLVIFEMWVADPHHIPTF